MNAVNVDRLRQVLDYNPQIIEYRLLNLTPDFAAFAQTHGLKLIAHALGEASDSLYTKIIESAADIVNLDESKSVIKLLRIESSKSKG